jgi:hypothetical protein
MFLLSLAGWFLRVVLCLMEYALLKPFPPLMEILSCAHWSHTTLKCFLEVLLQICFIKLKNASDLVLSDI